MIRDLVGSASEFGPDRYRKIVARKSQAERDEIRAAVKASGRSSEAPVASTRHIMVATEHFGVTRGDPVERHRRRTFAITTEGVFLALFVGGLAWVPFWFGSNRPIAWGINAVIFPGLAALYELSLVLRGAPHPVAIRRIGVSAVLFALVITWILVQNATWTPTDWHHPIWQLASDALGQPIAGSISADRDLTALALLRLMTAASVFWLALQLGRDADAGSNADLVGGGY